VPDPTPPAQTCPQCGATVSPLAPEGLCPACVAKRNLVGDTAFSGEAPGLARSVPTIDELAPHFPQLELVEYLGRGGMGVVYKARQKSLGRVVALKLLAPERVGKANFDERFTQEARALAVLSHPNIVTIFDFGQAGGFYFLLMEFVDGVNLRQAMQASRFTPEQALAIVPPVCEALQYAHEHGIVHRDIKPENLLLDRDGRVKIADFGVAKILDENSSFDLAESQPAGTPQYMAPEQKDHQRTDHRADIYSLGVVLYEMLTGELPADKLRLPSSRLRGMQIDVRLDEIVLRALEKTPELRYQTAAEMRTRVEAVTRTPAGAPHLAAKRPVAVRLLLALACTLVIGLICGAFVVFASWKGSRSAQAEANALRSQAAARKTWAHGATGESTRLVTASGRLSPVPGAPAKWQIHALVAEADIASAKIGQDVSFTLDALPQGISLGKIAQVGKTPIKVQNTVRYETIIDVNAGAADESKFQPGMTVSVTFLVEVYPKSSGDGAGEAKSVPAEARTGGGTRPSSHADADLSFGSGLLPDLVAAIERRIPTWPLRGSWQMPNVVFASGTENARVQAPITLRDVTPMQAVTHVAAAAGCVLEPIEAIADEERSPYAKGQVIGYRFVLDPTRAGRAAREQDAAPRDPKPDLSSAAGNQEEEIIRLARERLEQIRQSYEGNHVSLSEVDQAEGELALAEARADPLKRADARFTMATKYLERLESAHRAGHISDEEYNQAKQRKLEAELELRRARSDSSRKTERNADLKSAE